MNMYRYTYVNLFVSFCRQVDPFQMLIITTIYASYNCVPNTSLWKQFPGYQSLPNYNNSQSK